MLLCVPALGACLPYVPLGQRVPATELSIVQGVHLQRTGLQRREREAFIC